MQNIIMVRHGQASFGAEDYDNLSTLGRQQCLWLGDHMQQLGFVPSLAVEGSLKRHAQTLVEISKSVNIPQQVTDSAFIEIDTKAIIAGYRAKYSDLPDYEQDRKLVNRAFRMGLTAWFEGRFEADTISWAEFTANVLDGLARLEDQGENILVVTSGGTITAAVGAMLNLDAAAQVAMLLKIHNSSTTKLVRTQLGLELHSLNNVGHLETADKKGSLTYV